ncbi:NADH-quinone oxidoreductase subunit C [bacterium]|nr:NADH-quinone oxidoreductase subunit C [bacterium]
MSAATLGGARLVATTAGELVAQVKSLLDGGARFASLVADDRDGDPARLLLSYAFVSRSAKELVCLRASVEGGRSPSIAPFLPAASWAEREVSELFGWTFEGAPDQRPLVLHDDWPAGQFPLRKSFALTSPPPRDERPFDYCRVEGEGVMEIPVGPIHAGIIEPGHFRFSSIGETVLLLEARLFFVHRGLELRAQGLSPDQGAILAERTSGFGSLAHALAFARAVEAACGISVPAEARRLRALALELERIWNHVSDVAFLCAGTSLAALGAEGSILKERLYRANEALFGSRWLRGVVCVGGVRRAPSPEAVKSALAEVERVLGEFASFEKKLFGSATNMERLAGTGVLKRWTAVALGVVGVAARGSGIATDSRADLPVDDALEKDPFRLVRQREGDVAARARVRIQEVLVAWARIAALVAAGLPAAPLRSPVSLEATGEGFGWAEGARGELLTYARLERGKIARLKVRSPSRMNWAAVPFAMPGNIVPDFPLINKSFDLSYAGCDL